MNKKTVVIIYPYFFPGFKAGGPIQSLVNMVQALSPHYHFKVVTSAYDLNDQKPYSNVPVGQWTAVSIGNISVSIWYHPTLRMTKSFFRSLLHQASADVVFVNGLFTMWSLLPLWLYRWGDISPCRMIISPRGMLQQGALKSGVIRKKLYLDALKMIRLYKGLVWHATTAEEKNDIIAKAGNSVVIVAENIPKKPIEVLNLPEKRVGELKIVYLSLIAEKKNLLLALESVGKLDGRILFDIFGPIKDFDYWKKCLETIEHLPSNIQVMYKGEVKPEQVQSTIEQYHALISLTKGENFGHALFESLSVGRPLITSYFTPWNNLEFNRAGWNIDISNSPMVSFTLQKIVDTDQKVWDEICLGAWNLSKSYFANASFQKQYQELFG